MKGKAMLFLLKQNAPSGWDIAQGFVIRSKSSKTARKLASKKCGGEGMEVWLDPKQSSCCQLKEDGDDEIILEDFLAG